MARRNQKKASPAKFHQWLLLWDGIKKPAIGPPVFSFILFVVDG